MAVKVMMPKGSDTMTEGKVLKWLKKEGDAISTGDTVVEIETDKVNMEVEAMGRACSANPGGGRQGGARRRIAGGHCEGRRRHSALLKDAAAAPPPVAHPASQPAPAAPAPVAVGTPSIPAAPSSARVAAARSQAAARRACSGEVRPLPPPLPRCRRAPAASRSLRRPRAGFALGQAHGQGNGSGPELDHRKRPRRKDHSPRRGRAVRVRAPALSRRVRPWLRSLPAPSTRATVLCPGRARISDEPLSSMRKVIATRLVQSKGPVPHFYLAIEVDMQRAKELRESANLLDPELKLSYNDIILKACAAALRANPEVNASFQGESIRNYNRVHLGMAVATDGGGLITPVIRNCDTKSLAEISSESKELVARARTRKLLPEEYAGSTFSISNLGMMGIDEFSAIINPPEGAILAVGAVAEKPVVMDHRVGSRACAAA